MLHLLCVADIWAGLLAPVPAGGTDAPPPTAITFSTQWLPVKRGEPLRAEIGSFQVPENRTHPDGRQITLAFARIPSTAKIPGPPTVFLNGGPGIPTIGHFQNDPTLRSFLLSFLEVSDVVLLDQRGTGRSRPSLMSREKSLIPRQALVSKANADAFTFESARAFAKELQRDGIDISSYNTQENADDVDALCQALCENAINIIGFSYGTHLGLSVLKRHPSRIHRAVLMGTAGLGQLRKMPHSIQAQLERIAALSNADPNVNRAVPDLLALMKSVLERLERKPITMTLTDGKGNTQTVEMGRIALELITFADLNDTNDFINFPRLYYTLSQGDVSVLRPFAHKRFYGAKPAYAMPIAMRFASGVSQARRKEIDREAASCLIWDAVDFPFQNEAIRDIYGIRDLGDAFRAPVASDVPTLFLSGTLEGNAPTEETREIMKGFTKATLVLYENGGHEEFWSVPEGAQIVLTHLQGKPVSIGKIALPVPKFTPIR